MREILWELGISTMLSCAMPTDYNSIWLDILTVISGIQQKNNEGDKRTKDPRTLR